jgi:hypothetical protein
MVILQRIVAKRGDRRVGYDRRRQGRYRGLRQRRSCGGEEKCCDVIKFHGDRLAGEMRKSPAQIDKIWPLVD